MINHQTGLRREGREAGGRCRVIRKQGGIGALEVSMRSRGR